MKYLLLIFLMFLGHLALCDSVSEEAWQEEKKDYVYSKKKKEEEVQQKNPPKTTSGSEKIPNASSNLSWLKFLAHPTFLYAVILIVILTVLVLLLKNITIPQKLKNAEISYTDDQIEERLMETDIERLIRLALENGNYQLAIRYTFLKTLKSLVEHNKLNWKKQYTNRDYLTQLYQTNYYEGFRAIVLTYERKWYRDDVSTMEEFEHYKNSCKQLNPNL
jgi:hypothetical protein